jgi:hypothetical protein
MIFEAIPDPWFSWLFIYFVLQSSQLFYYIVQGHRFNVGRQAAIYISIEAIFIIWLPPTSLLEDFAIAFTFGALVLQILSP